MKHKAKPNLYSNRFRDCQSCCHIQSIPIDDMKIGWSMEWWHAELMRCCSKELKMQWRHFRNWMIGANCDCMLTTSKQLWVLHRALDPAFSSRLQGRSGMHGQSCKPWAAQMQCAGTADWLTSSFLVGARMSKRDTFRRTIQSQLKLNLQVMRHCSKELKMLWRHFRNWMIGANCDCMLTTSKQLWVLHRALDPAFSSRLQGRSGMHGQSCKPWAAQMQCAGTADWLTSSFLVGARMSKRDTFRRTIQSQLKLNLQVMRHCSKELKMLWRHFRNWMIGANCDFMLTTSKQLWVLHRALDPAFSSRFQGRSGMHGQSCKPWAAQMQCAGTADWLTSSFLVGARMSKRDTFRRTIQSQLKLNLQVMRHCSKELKMLWRHFRNWMIGANCDCMLTTSKQLWVLHRALDPAFSSRLQGRSGMHGQSCKTWAAQMQCVATADWLTSSFLVGARMSKRDTFRRTIQSQLKLNLQVMRHCSKELKMLWRHFRNWMIGANCDCMLTTSKQLWVLHRALDPAFSSRLQGRSGMHGQSCKTWAAQMQCVATADWLTSLFLVGVSMGRRLFQILKRKVPWTAGVSKTPALWCRSRVVGVRLAWPLSDTLRSVGRWMASWNSSVSDGRVPHNLQPFPSCKSPVQMLGKGKRVLRMELYIWVGWWRLSLELLFEDGSIGLSVFVWDESNCQRLSQVTLFVCCPLAFPNWEQFALWGWKPSAPEKPVGPAVFFSKSQLFPPCHKTAQELMISLPQNRGSRDRWRAGTCQSLRDLWRLRRNQEALQRMPDVVLQPQNEEEVVSILQQAGSSPGFMVIPVSGRTGSTSGCPSLAEDSRPVVALDMRNLEIMSFLEGSPSSCTLNHDSYDSTSLIHKTRDQTIDPGFFNSCGSFVTFCREKPWLSMTLMWLFGGWWAEVSTRHLC